MALAAGERNPPEAQPSQASVPAEPPKPRVTAGPAPGLPNISGLWDAYVSGRTLVIHQEGISTKGEWQLNGVPFESVELGFVAGTRKYVGEGVATLNGIDPIAWALSARRIRCPRWPRTPSGGACAGHSPMSSRRARYAWSSSKASVDTENRPLMDT
jgi:hypothetical protein